jgi:hypothetical protein
VDAIHPYGLNWGIVMSTRIGQYSRRINNGPETVGNISNPGKFGCAAVDAGGNFFHA